MPAEVCTQCPKCDAWITVRESEMGATMNCPKCGGENPDDSNACSSCGIALLKVTIADKALIPRVSRLASAALLFAVLSPFTCGLTILPAIILGIISFIIIEKSGGRNPWIRSPVYEAKTFPGRFNIHGVRKIVDWTRV